MGGPPFARFLANAGGQTAYAWQQLGITLLSFLLMEWKVMAAHTVQLHGLSKEHVPLVEEVELSRKSSSELEYAILKSPCPSPRRALAELQNSQ